MNGASAARGATLRLFELTRPNPQPEIKVDKLDFVSGVSQCAPFLIAITAKP